MLCKGSMKTALEDLICDLLQSVSASMWRAISARNIGCDSSVSEVGFDGLLIIQPSKSMLL